MRRKERPSCIVARGNTAGILQRIEGMHAVPWEVYTGEKRRTGKGEREKRPLVAEKKEKGMRKKTDRLGGPLYALD